MIAGKRTFSDLRKEILLCLSTGQHTINQLSYETRINWRTVELHLTYLVGKGLIREAFSSKYARVFELSELGVNYIQLFGVHNVHRNDIVRREIRL
ncbi:MAG TPA: ArsR family transcriptional regulator [Candidatus Nanoarchaeia archaeon]|nr:ArsR family transcriptional regulator [Candidatus Nanoarchaeia archaeon]